MPNQNQDLQQRVTVSFTVGLELYRTLVSCLLILFVPQKCGTETCTYQENMTPDNSLYVGGLVVNFVTLFAFLMLYAVEVLREHCLIAYLDSNKALPYDKDTVATHLRASLPAVYSDRIYRLDWIYNGFGLCCCALFCGNTVLSGIIVSWYAMGNQTFTVFATNVLFMVNKIYSIYTLANTDESVFYSAYLVERVQFNDVDTKADTKVLEHEIVVKEEIKEEVKNEVEEEVRVVELARYDQYHLSSDSDEKSEDQV